MTFIRDIPLNITGPSYESRSKPLSSQKTQNFYHQIVDAGKETYVLHSFPGLLNITSATGNDRGGWRMAGTGYRVSGQTLYSFDSAGVHTSLGSIEGSTRCVFATDGTNLVIVANTKVYVYDGATVTEVVDSNIVGATAVTYLNNQMIYTNNNLFVVATVGDPTTANGLDQAAAESQPDSLVRAYAFQQTLYMVGSESTEPFWNTGEGNPPFERIDGQIFEVGTSALHSVAHTDEALYWLGDDKAVYQVSGGIKKRISTTAISHAIDSYSKVDDAYAYTFTMEGMNFYAITFPTADKTWCLNESLSNGGWFELSSGLSSGKYQASTILKTYDANYAFDADNGNLYKLGINPYTNNGDAIKRIRVTSSVNGDLLKKKGARIQISKLRLIMETGVGAITGQGENPKIQFEISFDGGKSWAPQDWMEVGRLGEFDLLAELDTLESGYDMIFRMTTTDPVPFELYSASVDIRLAGR